MYIFFISKPNILEVLVFELQRWKKTWKLAVDGFEIVASSDLSLEIREM